MARRTTKTAATYDAWLNEGDERTAKIAAIDADFLDGPGGECFDKAGIARIMGLTAYAVDSAIRRGATVQRRGDQFTPWQINVSDFLRWTIKDACGLLDDADDTKAAETHRHKTRKMAAHADRVEMHNAAVLAETLTLDEVTEIYREEADLIRRELNAIPGRAVEALGKLDADERRNASIVENVLDDCVNNALKAISSSGVEKNANA
jgi:phage terminase Nu1 subunit (DNA packaging protein)